ncbi:MAG TPA: ATP-binding protein [bacterium]
MRVGIRGKLFLISFFLILIVVFISSLYLEYGLVGRLESDIRDRLHTAANSGKEIVEVAGTGNSEYSFDELADRIGNSTGIRITLVNSDGTVLGDSMLSPGEVAEIENHSNRPEVQAALGSGAGDSRRYSSTLNTDMLYYAIPFSTGETTGVIRAAMPLSEVDRNVVLLRWSITGAGILGLGIAIVMTLLASHLMSADLRNLIEQAKNIAEGKEKSRITIKTSDEISGLAGSLNRLQDELEIMVQELASQRSHLEAVLEGIGEAVIAIDRDNVITMTNSAAQKLLEIDQSPVGKTLLETIRVPVLHEMTESLNPGNSGTVEIDFQGTEKKRVLVNAVSQYTSNITVVVMQDITDMRRLENIRKEFVANVSHELRTPVSVIRANAETLMNGAINDREKSEKIIGAIVRNAERLGGIIGDLLTISRIESGTFRISSEKLELTGIIRAVVESLNAVVEQKKQEIEFRLDEKVEVMGDRTAIDEVIVNLLDNAIKYSGPGEKIAVSSSIENGCVKVSVADHGAGIRKRDRARIFERFYRVDQGRSKDTGGTGLGLSIVKHLVSSMGGQVGVGENTPNGSIFWFTLPLATPENA